MKTLAIGFLIFFIWSALSTYFYVCKIKVLCRGCSKGIEGPVVAGTALTDASMPDIKTSLPLIPENITVYFDFDKFDFKSSSKADSSGDYILKNLDVRLNITGYADTSVSEEYNMALGLRRAENKWVAQARELAKITSHLKH